MHFGSLPVEQRLKYSQRIIKYINLYQGRSTELVSWDEAVRRCTTSSSEPLYLPGFSDEEFQEAGEYMNKHEITSMWINLKYSHEFVWNSGSVYSRFCLFSFSN